MKRPLTNEHPGAPGRRRFLLRRGGWLCAVLLGFAVTPLGAATFKATLNTDTISLGESATLSLTFEGGSPKDVPAPPPIPNLQINYIGPSSQFSYINGQVSSTVTHNFTVTPQQVGEFTLPSLSADVGGEKLRTQPLKLKVIKPGAPPPEAVNAGSQLAFLKLSLPRKEVYLGETLTGELRFYFRQGVGLAEQPHLTALPVEGFATGKLQEGQQRQVQIGNATYTVVPVAIAFTALKTGPLSVGPITASVVLEVPSANRRRDPFFEQFGMRSPFDSGTEQKQVVIATDAETAQSLPLPAANVPSSFNGAVGSYTLTVNAGPTNVAAGDPITVRVQIAGHGALDALTLPEQAGWHDFKSYPPTAKVETTDALGLQGTKTFEQIVVPQNTDIRALPPFTFSFFDPDQKAYRTLTQPPVPLVVRPGGTAPAPVMLAANPAAAEIPPPQRDIVPIKQRLGTVTRTGPPLVAQPWFLTVQGLPMMAWLAAFVWRRRSDALENNPRLRRQRQVAHTIRNGLNDLRRLAAGNKSDEFFAALFHLLQEQLGERLDCPATSITEAVVDEKLRPRGVPEDTIETLRELFHFCNLARYTPLQSSQELAALIPKCETVLGALQNVRI